MRNQNKTINLLPSYLRMSFSSEVLFPCKINETPEIVEPLLSPNAQLSASQFSLLLNSPQKSSINLSVSTLLSLKLLSRQHSAQGIPSSQNSYSLDLQAPKGKSPHGSLITAESLHLSRKPPQWQWKPPWKTLTPLAPEISFSPKALPLCNSFSFSNGKSTHPKHSLLQPKRTPTCSWPATPQQPAAFADSSLPSVNL